MDRKDGSTMASQYITESDVERMFTYRPWTDEEVRKYRPLRDMAKELALEVVRRVPDSPERTLALRALHDASMKINLAISMHPEKEV